MGDPRREGAPGALKDHLEAIPPGGVAWLTREQLGQTPAEFAATLLVLEDLERADEVRLGERRPDAVEIERIA
jgi:hypothetical protein